MTPTHRSRFGRLRFCFSLSPRPDVCICPLFCQPLILHEPNLCKVLVISKKTCVLASSAKYEHYERRCGVRILIIPQTCAIRASSAALSSAIAASLSALHLLSASVLSATAFALACVFANGVTGRMCLAPSVACSKSRRRTLGQMSMTRLRTKPTRWLGSPLHQQGYIGNQKYSKPSTDAVLKKNLLRNRLSTFRYKKSEFPHLSALVPKRTQRELLK